MQPLVLIPARGGSKGLPNKNIKLLQGKPLICYSIDAGRSLCSDDHICISTDSEKIAQTVLDYGLAIPFKRPAELATDHAGSREVIIHALDHYKSKGVEYDVVVLLQPTSPFRHYDDIKQMCSLFSPNVDMVVSVFQPHYSPYFNLFEENTEGFLKKSKESAFARRQDCPTVYAFNGSVYVINAISIRNKPFDQFNKVTKYVMDEILSVDIDTDIDWWLAETILQKSLWVDGETKS